MQLTNQVMATKEAYMDFVHNYPADTPVVMLNILKFRDKAEGSDESGEEAYNRYGRQVHPLMLKYGGKVLWAGKVKNTVIGDGAEQPDRILVVHWPNKEAFVAFSTSEEYRPIGKHREIALTYGGLIATEPLDFG